tara:strand:- start:1398 stop:1649 length:252 start_codon:yes stop_codon:yes gene_type:complete
VKIVIYTTSYCPFCDAAKNLLKSLNIEFDEVDLTDNLEERLEISTKYNWRTVPLILINNKLIGGFDELNNLNNNGELESLLSS